MLWQAKLDELIGSSSGFIESLPLKVRRRIQYLEQLQETHDELVEAFDEELAALEEKYRLQYGAQPWALPVAYLLFPARSGQARSDWKCQPAPISGRLSDRMGPLRADFSIYCHSDGV